MTRPVAGSGVRGAAMPARVPAARRDEITQRALDELARVPDYVWDGVSLPVPVEAIADSHYGLHVGERQDLADRVPGLPPLEDGARLSGVLVLDRREIWVDAWEAEQWPRRRRFTIAHEIGHLVLHAPASDRPTFCRAGDVRTPREDGTVPTAPDTVEAEANLFAAALLMPPPLVQREARALGREVSALADRFECSESALNPRFRYLLQYRAPSGAPKWHRA